MKRFAMLLVLAACKRGPAPAVECSGYDHSTALVGGTLTIEPQSTDKWSCADGKERKVECRLRDAKHVCTCTAGKSTDAKFDWDSKLPEKEPAWRAFANEHCGWNMQAKN